MSRAIPGRVKMLVEILQEWVFLVQFQKSEMIRSCSTIMLTPDVRVVSMVLASVHTSGTKLNPVSSQFFIDGNLLELGLILFVPPFLQSLVPEHFQKSGKRNMSPSECASKTKSTQTTSIAMLGGHSRKLEGSRLIWLEFGNSAVSKCVKHVIFTWNSSNLSSSPMTWKTTTDRRWFYCFRFQVTRADYPIIRVLMFSVNRNYKHYLNRMMAIWKLFVLSTSGTIP